MDESSGLVSSVVRYVDHKEVTYFEITNGMLIAKDTRDDFEWFVSRKEPKARRDVMAKTAPLDMSEVGRGKEWYSPW